MLGRGGCPAKCRTFATHQIKPTERMARREFATQKNFHDYAERTGQAYLWEGTAVFAKRQRLLSPDQYEIVDVRTSRGVRRAMLFPKPVRSRRRADLATIDSTEVISVTQSTSPSFRESPALESGLSAPRAHAS